MNVKEKFLKHTEFGPFANTFEFVVIHPTKSERSADVVLATEVCVGQVESQLWRRTLREEVCYRDISECILIVYC